MIKGLAENRDERSTVSNFKESGCKSNQLKDCE